MPQSPVRTYVFAKTTTDDATPATEGRAEATRILIDYFKKQKSKTIAVVESEEVADATVELLSVKPVTGDIQDQATTQSANTARRWSSRPSSSRWQE